MDLQTEVKGLSAAAFGIEVDIGGSIVALGEERHSLSIGRLAQLGKSQRFSDPGHEASLELNERANFFAPRKVSS